MLLQKVHELSGIKRLHTPEKLNSRIFHRTEQILRVPQDLLFQNIGQSF